MSGERPGRMRITSTLKARRKQVYLFSSQDGHVSLETDDYRHGYFTYHLLQAWNNEKLRRADEIFHYVWSRVKEDTNDRQIPDRDIRHENIVIF